MARLYDQYGNHIGSVDSYQGSRARINDEYGNHIGYIEVTRDSKNRILDQYGNHTGYIEKTGGTRDRILDQYGNHTGYIDYSKNPTPIETSNNSSEYSDGTGCLWKLFCVALWIAMISGGLKLLHWLVVG